MDLSIATTKTGSHVQLALAGEIDLATTGDVHDAVLGVLTEEPDATVVLDFHEVSFIDSRGMGTLVACQRAAEVGGGSLRLERLGPFVRRQLFAAGLLGLLTTVKQQGDGAHLDAG